MTFENNAIKFDFQCLPGASELMYDWNGPSVLQTDARPKPSGYGTDNAVQGYCWRV